MDEVPLASELPQAMLDEARSELALADGKASILLGAIGVVAGAGIAAMLAGWSPLDLAGGAQFFWWIGALSMATAGLYAGRAVWPRMAKRKTGEPISFWGHVAQIPTVAKMTSQLKSQQLDIAERTLNQLHAVSQIIDRKYRLLRVALAALGVAAFALAISALLAVL